MDDAKLSPVMEDYLKTIFHLLQEEGEATTNGIAGALGVSAPTVTQAIKKLADRGMVEYTPYRGVVLTSSGKLTALEIIRHHRLIERYLHEALGLSWDVVHREAERWEHMLSDEVEERMARALNHPTRDPHGSPIPTADLVLPEDDRMAVAELAVGEMGNVVEVPDEDPAFLNRLECAGLLPGRSFRIVDSDPSGEMVVLEVGGNSVRMEKEALSFPGSSARSDKGNAPPPCAATIYRSASSSRYFTHASSL
jgi:DtxR family Mn-dependent transcriptional regulator